MKKCFLLLLLSAICYGISVAQKITFPANAEAAGFSAERLKRIDVKLNEWVKKGWAPGAVGLVIHDGKVVYYNAVGYSDIAAKKQLQKDDIFRIASQTKAITSVAALILYEEGKFLLDDPVSNYIPSFKNPQVLDKFNSADSSYTTVPAKREVTIRDLLTHTSGIGYAQIGSPEANAIYAKAKLTPGLDVSNESLADAMTRLGKQPLFAQPGEKWIYGLNLDLLGYLVEIWSGKSLEDFFRERIFNPLGMKDTWFNLPASKGSRLVPVYGEDSVGNLFRFTTEGLGGDPSYPLKTKSYFSGGGGLSSTAYDYAIFLQMLLNGGVYNGQRIISRNTVRIMTQNQIGDVNFGEDKFGLGFALVTAKSSGKTLANEGTFSWGGAFTTSYWVDPKEKLVLVFYRQMLGTTHGNLSDYFRVLAYQALK
jgi:CubicO group peptidase (beta-lactamase class C family)